MRLTNEVARKNEEEETSKDLPDCDFGIGDVPHIRDDERGGGGSNAADGISLH